MRKCPSCGRENPPDRDFCTCGEYLRWEPTTFSEAVEPTAGAQASEQADANATMAPAASAGQTPSALAAGTAAQVPGGPTGAPGATPVADDPRPAAREAPPDVASLVLRLPDQDGPPEGPIRLEVDPGARVTLIALIRNQGSIVDNYDIAVSGLPTGWWTVTPATAYLVPYGSSGTYEQEIQVHLQPPRTPEAVARPWAIEVTARSRAYETQVASAPTTLVIGPYRDVACEIRPERASGKLKARFALTVRNRANAPADVSLDAADADAECQFRFAEPSIAIQPGQTIEAPFTIFPPRQLWLGRPRERRLQVAATPAGSEQPKAPCTAVYRQRPWLPWWLAIVAPIVLALVILLALLLPKHTTVPNLRKAASAFAAEKLLNEAGLKLSPEIGQAANTGAAPGTIVDQSPAAGKHVRKGSLVSIQIAAGSGTDTVPSVIGQTPVAADATLRAAGVSLGTISPQPVNPKGTIASQIPAANQKVQGGTPVAVFLAPASAGGAKASGGAKAAGGAAGAGAAAAAAAAAIVVPSLKGSPTEAAAQLSQAGLVPQVAERLSTSPPGGVIGSVPPAGTKVRKGATVQVLVSRGFPELSYDDAHSIYFVNGASGKAVTTAPPSTSAQEEATWSADGSHVVYRQGGALVLLRPNKQGVQPFVLTGPGSDAHDPAFAPTRTANILAFIERRSGTGRLCLATVGPNALAPDCTSHPGWDLGGQLAWSPDGSQILVFGVQVGHPGTFGLIDFASNVPFSTHASDWGHGVLVTNDSKTNEGVIAGALSPSGRQLALIANFGGSGFRLYLTKPQDFALAFATALPVSACELSWRPDSGGLALMEADSACQEATGRIVTFELAKPQSETAIAANAAHPAWQPVSGHG
jgi:beta-lactam-binding protein with PASTA domain